MEIKIMEKVLAANDAWALENRNFLKERGIRMYNLIGSPGAGKTALLEKTIELLGGSPRVGVVEGDLATARDAQRIHRKGVPVFQINTGTACHLNANLINTALKDLCDGAKLDLVFVENVGNLVCPASLDIGEHAKIAVLSVTEGDDKVEKYPVLFAEARAVVISKTGLIRHTDFDLDAVTGAIRRVNPDAKIFPLDSLAATGFDPWIALVRGDV